MREVVELEDLAFGTSFDDELVEVFAGEVDVFKVAGLSWLGFEADDYF